MSSHNQCIVRYYTDSQGERRWRCGKYLMCSAVEFRMTSEKCYHYKCPGRKPPIKICAWKDCINRVAPNKERHCSEVCRKRDNRWAYRQRQKEKIAKEKALIKICAWKDCDLPVAPNKERHCSEICRKRDNRWAYRQRQKAMKEK